MGKFGSFLLGAALGAGAALLLAPQTGEQARALVSEKANAVAGEAKDFGEGMSGSAQDTLKSVQEKGAAALKDLTAKGKELAGNAQSKVDQVQDAMADGAKGTEGDELREKIEAARQRIAAQVMENAEQAKGAAGDVKEAAAESAGTVAHEVADVAESAKHAAAEKVEQGAEKVADKAAEAK